ncbi:expressed unknown protein [Seminavis robusta]|uniref:Uncharacterized protein n=1 Tax=Seminavis robusta TaxID=568900 RepID=A0A9N8E8Q7_9STRA|nr:expressed unknown protein [Seminavis robusta]|eukprot:Sro808_g205410.1 n/a (401) ;mRNA; f:20870-22072
MGKIRLWSGLLLSLGLCLVAYLCVDNEAIASFAPRDLNRKKDQKNDTFSRLPLTRTPSAHPLLTANDTDSNVSIPLYKNLSCPFEMSKFSCFRQGRHRQAQASFDLAAKRKRPRYWWQSNNNSNYTVPTDEYIPKLLLVGDSTMRQVFVALGCFFWHQDMIAKFYMDWKPYWPCHGFPGCVTSGKHSGFDAGRIRLKQGLDIFFFPHAGGLDHNQKEIIDNWLKSWKETGKLKFQLQPTGYPFGLGRRDTVVYTVGMHLTPWSRKKIYPKIDQLGRALRQARINGRNAPTFVLQTSTTQHFNSPDGQYYKYMMGSSPPIPLNTTVNGCRSSLPINPRRESELKVFQEGQNVDVILDVPDEDMGDYHVGGNDCTHYCMAGVPDLIAMNLLDRLGEHFGQSQ